MEQILPAEHEQEMRRLNDELQSLEVHKRKDEEHRLEHLCQVRVQSFVNKQKKFLNNNKGFE